VGARANLTILEDQETTSTVGPPLIEMLSPAARQRSHRRRALTALARLFLATATAFMVINVKDFDTSPTMITSTHARSVAALAPEGPLANDITLTESNQANVSARWWNITFIDHGDSACSLRGDPVPQFVQGAARNPLGPRNQQIVTPQRPKQCRWGYRPEGAPPSWP
jgi:hypothetical protein